jgi:hypothetical protein
VKGKIKYEFTALVWPYTGPAAWYFVSLPKEMAAEIRENFQWQEEGWGRLKATAKIGNSQWDSAIWFDKKQNTYLLPLKAEIRRKENIAADSTVLVTIWV